MNKHYFSNFSTGLKTFKLQIKDSSINSVPDELSNSPLKLPAENNVISCLLAKNSYPLSTISCPLTIKSKLFFFIKFSTTFSPKITPLLILFPKISSLQFLSNSKTFLSGSLHNKSHKKPSIRNFSWSRNFKNIFWTF